MSEKNLSPTLNFEEGFFSHFTEILSEVTHSRNSAFDDAPYFIGMMGGTSLDGLDAVLCQFYEINEDNNEPVEILASVSEPFPEPLKSLLLALTEPNGVKKIIENQEFPFESELDVFGWASREYAEFASELVKQLLINGHTTPDEVSAIGCHGQTVRHRPEWGFSLQLLDPNVLAERTGIAVVNDFRRRDMAVGGQGAPLVPAFHQAMFGHQQHLPTVILNLGGIANITVLNSEQVIGFDTGVANLLIDAWCLEHTGQVFDKDGEWAKSGHIIEPLLNEMLSHEFFAKAPPKSTGREMFNMIWVNNLLEKLNHEMPNLAYSPADVQATLTELTAVSVAQAIKNVMGEVSGQLLVCGGGAYNGFLLERLQKNLDHWHVVTTNKMGLSPKWVESVAFAWLARQTLLGVPSNLPSVTGASKKVILGQVCF